MPVANFLREDVIKKVNDLSEDKLKIVDSFLKSLSEKNKMDDIDAIYKKAVERYHETLQKLAQ